MIDARAALEAALRADDIEGLLGLFRGMTEDDRRALAPRALEWCRTALHFKYAPVGKSNTESGPPEAMRAGAAEPGCVAALATAKWTELKRLGIFAIPEIDHAYRVIEDRRPEWLSSWAAWVGEERFNSHWLLVRRLERQGWLTRPAGPWYWLGMAVSIPHNEPRRGVGSTPRARPVIEMLLEDAPLLDDALWRMLEDDAAVTRIAHNDSFRAGTQLEDERWNLALLQLADDGVIPRDRLLGSILDGLGRGGATAGRWFADVLNAMRPTLEEQAACVDSYLRLLAAGTPSAVETGVDGLTLLLRGGRLAAAALVDAVAPLLTARTKNRALAGLRLLTEGAEREPEAWLLLAGGALPAFTHDAVDVHTRALDLILRRPRHDADAVADALREVLTQIAPSQRARAEAWLGSGTEVTAPSPEVVTGVEDGGLAALETQAAALGDEAAALAGLPEAVRAAQGEADLPAAWAGGDLRIPRLDPDGQWTPVATIDELIDILLRVLENAANAEDVERALDGMGRLGAERPTDFRERTGSLTQRARHVLVSQDGFRSPFLGLDAVADVAATALAWTEKRQPPARQDEVVAGVQAVLGERCRCLAARLVAGRPQPLLAAPTHRRGLVDPRVVPQRWLAITASGDESPDLVEQVLVLLRLAPDHRATALVAARSLPGEFGAALRYALGGEEGIGATASLWVAAARSRAPWSDDPAVEARHPGLGPDAGLVPRYVPAVRKHGRVFGGDGQQIRVDWQPEMRIRRDALLPTVLLHSDEQNFLSSVLASAWQATVWPLGTEAFFASQLNRLTGFLESQGTYWQGDWDLLFDPDVPIGSVGRLLIVVGTMARQPTASGLARDALAAALGDGRIDAQGLGETLAFVLAAEGVKHARLIAALRQVAPISALHHVVVRAALERAAASLPSGPPALVVSILEILSEWTVAEGEGIVYDSARRRLAEITGSGKGARLAKALLGLVRSRSGTMKDPATRLSLASRIERAARYQRRLLWSSESEATASLNRGGGQ